MLLIVTNSCDQDLVWDFRLPRVVSINASGHKYGLVYPGVGWVVWRDAEHLPQELVFNINYLGADQSSFTLNFSKGASQVIGQYVRDNFHPPENKSFPSAAHARRTLSGSRS